MFRTGLSSILIALAAAGCASQPAPVTLDLQGVSPAADYADLSAVLAKAIDGRGRILPKPLRKAAGRLDAQLAMLAVTGPTATPELLADDDHRLAYWYNARAAWSLKLAMLDDFAESVTEPQLMLRRFPLDGRTMTIEQIDRAILDGFGWQALTAAPSACIYGAPMPRSAFEPNDVRRQIAERFNDFIGDSRRFVIDVEHKRVLVPPVLWRFRDELIESHNRRYGTKGASLITALLPYTSGSAHRRLQDAVGYSAVQAGDKSTLATATKKP